MKTLVLHPKDKTTEFLSKIYLDRNYTIIRENISTKKLKEVIKNHDRIIMLGHGTEKGLLGFGRFIIKASLVYLLRDKLSICIWCNSDVFFKKYGLKGMCTGMIISELDEAYDYNVKCTLEDIEESNELLSKALSNSFINSEIKKVYNSNTNYVIQFNSENIFGF